MHTEQMLHHDSNTEGFRAVNAAALAAGNRLGLDELTKNRNTGLGSYDADSEIAGWDSPGRAQKLVEPYITPGSKVLDIGIGTGQAVRGYAQRGVTVVGLDHDTSMLIAARSVVGDTGLLREADINKPLPIDDIKESVDVALAVGVLEFAEDLRGILGQVRNSLKENGIFAFTCELVNSERTVELQTYFPDIDITVYRHSAEEVGMLIDETGYELVSSDEYSGYERGDDDVLYGIFLVQKLSRASIE
jgi:SAM-dependent methyltransferase